MTRLLRYLKKYSAGLAGGALATVLIGASITSYNHFFPGGGLSGTWNSQNLELGAGTSFVHGQLPTVSGGSGANCTPTNGQLLIGSTASGNFGCASLTAGANITLTPAAHGLTIAATGSGPQIAVVTGSDTRNSTTLAPDSFLTFSFGAGDYDIQCDLFFTSAATSTFPGSRVQFVTSGSTENGAMSVIGVATGSAGATTLSLGSGSGITQAQASQNQIWMQNFRAIFDATALSTITLSWAQGATNASFPTTLLANSNCMLWQT